MGLHGHRKDPAVGAGNAHVFTHPLGCVVRETNGAHFAPAHQRVQGLGRFPKGNRVVVLVREIQVDVIRLQAPQGLVGGKTNILRAQTRSAAQLSYLGGHNHVGAITARGHPRANDALGLAAHVSRFPGRVGIRGVNEVSATRNVRIENSL